MIFQMGLIGLPFALTETFFYPDYWEPRSLFSLIERIGFGLEDLLFVFGLAGLTSTIYPFMFGKSLASLGSQRQSPSQILSIIVLFFGVIAGLVLLTFWIAIPMIYGAILIMIVLGILILWYRKDLIIPSLWGGIATTLAYTTICMILLWLYPNIFQMTWHTDRFMNVFFLGVPLEEILYGFCAGFTGTIFYPSLFRLRFVKA